MSQPAFTGLEAPYRTKVPGGASDATGAWLDVGRGDWQQGKGNDVPLDRPKWMATVDVDGRRVWGVTPQMPFAAGVDVVLPGEQDWGTRLRLDLAKLGFADGRTHSLVTCIYAASYWPGGWGDNAQQPPGWEWGHYAASDDSPAVFIQSFVVPSAQPAPAIDAAALRAHVIDELVPLFRQWKRNGLTYDQVKDLRFPRAYMVLVEALPLPSFRQLYASLS
jgi:hypothetical protein